MVRLPRDAQRRTVLVLAAVLLALGFGFCILPGHHGDGGNHGHSPELCAGLVVVVLTMATPLVKPALSGWVVAGLRAVVPLLLIALIELPPELALTA